MLEILETLCNLFISVILPSPKFWCIVSGAISISVIGVYFKTKQNLRSAEYSLNIIRDISKALAKNHEVTAFGNDNDVLYTTHPQLYETKEEFLQNLSTRVMASENYQNFRKCLELNMHCNTTISGSGSGLHNQFRKWLATINTLDAQNSMICEKISLVTISDVSKQFSEAEKVSANYEKLENFIDHFPFGIFYINNAGEIIGTNTTFANMVNAQKEKLIGINIREFIENFNSELPLQKQLNVTIKPRFARTFSGTVIKSPANTGFTMSPWILCKLDDFFDTSEQVGEVSKNVFASTAIPSVITTVSGKIIALNPAFASLMQVQDKVIMGHSQMGLVGSNIRDLVTVSNMDFLAYLKSAYESDAVSQTLEVKFNGEKSTAMLYLSRIGSYVLVQLIDISMQKVLEQQFIRSQKMQAIGQLAGGIAHDFNNLLTAMIGFCDLVLQRYVPNDPSYGDVVQIKQNAGRAANLVKQLLAFSKQQSLKPRVVSITEILVGISSLLRQLVGVNIDLQIAHGRDIWNVKIDDNQFEQVIINLVVNARDAIKNSGTIKISTQNFYAEKEFKCAYNIAHPGDYVLIEVSDTGSGIPPADIENIFEPFFSRKDENIRQRVGTGTGLGLSTAYGIVNQTGGFISVESELGKGTTFRIYLPRYVGTEDAKTTEKNDAKKDLNGTETILLVEDEEPVRMFSARALRDKGYKILEASCGEEALEIAQDNRIDLLITDVVMPKMDGPTLSKILREKLPNLRTLFISGYTEDTFRQDLCKNSDIYFLQKPFTLRDLAMKVKEVLRNDE